MIEPEISEEKYTDNIRRYYDKEIQMDVIEMTKEYYLSLPRYIRDSTYGLEPVKIKLI